MAVYRTQRVRKVHTGSYLKALKIPLTGGRDFSTDFPSDSAHSVLVNETFVKKAGWKNPIGRLVNFKYNNNRTYQVIGVVKDYHFAALNQKITPQLFTMNNANSYGTFYIRIRPVSACSAYLYYLLKSGPKRSAYEKYWGRLFKASLLLCPKTL